MGLVDHSESITVPYSPENAYRALVIGCTKLNEDEFVLEKIDDNIRTVYLKGRLSLFSWGETITVSISNTSTGEAEVKISSTPKTGAAFGGIMDMGKNKKNIEKIMYVLSEELSDYPQHIPQENQKNASVIDEIKEYAKLMQEGLITEEEYNQKKKQLLGI